MSTSFDPAAGEFFPACIRSFEYPDVVMGESIRGGPESSGQPNPAECNPSSAPGSSADEVAGRILEARAEGIREGEQRARAHAEKQSRDLRDTVAKALSEFEKEKSHYYAKVESEVVNLALAIAAKILHREAQVDPLLVAGLVKVALNKLSHGTTVRVHVSPGDLDGWRQAFRDQMNSSENVQLMSDTSLPQGGCMLESELGTMDLGIESQLKEIEKGFFDLLAKRPTQK